MKDGSEQPWSVQTAAMGREHAHESAARSGGEVCLNCGGRMIGDGVTVVRHCEFVGWPLDVEPDADPIFCNDRDGEAAP